MPELDLIAYLDGEADATTTRRLDAQLVSDPRLRSEALRLLRQRVALARVLPAVDRPQLRPLRWRILGPMLAAAAGLVIATMLYRTSAAAVPTTGDPAPSHAIRLADGRAWEAGQALRADSPQLYRLADGTTLELAAGTTLLVGTPDAPWRLDSGSFTCALPNGSQSLSSGVATTEALLRISGGATVRRDATGTRISAAHGGTTVQDRLSGARHAMDARLCWIPADIAAPQSIDGAGGTLRGIVVEVDNRRSVSLRTRFGTVDLRPEWIQARPGVRGGLDPAPLRDVKTGDAVEIAWRHNEHLRVLSVRRLPGIPADAVIPQVTAPPEAAF